MTQDQIPVDIDPGREHRTFVIGDGESHKSLSTIESLCSQFAEWGLTRTDCVVGLGGGMVTDVAGFAAAVYHRGVPVVHVATSLLGQIDAAIGGKTGVNLPEGKNLVGAYWQPSAVICDTATLSTLPPREWRCGLGELAKYHWLGGGRLDELDLDERVARCVEIKAEVVASDERESGRRALLNYGHTLGPRARGRRRPPAAPRRGRGGRAGLRRRAGPRDWDASTTLRSRSTVGSCRATTCRPPCPTDSTTTSSWR